jgi:serine/threonine protein kinase
MQRRAASLSKPRRSGETSMTGTLAESVKIDRLNMSERRECRVEIVRRRLQNRAVKKRAEMESRVAFVVVRTSLGDALRLCTRGDAASRASMSAQVEDSALPERPTPLKDDHSFWKIYEKGETIGRGHFAKVKLVRHRKSGGFFAAKILDKQLEEHQEDYDAMMREFRVLRSLRHENIVQLEDAYESPTSLILVCQLATGGELMHRIAEEGDVYNEEEVKYHIKTILLGLKYMHERGVVHRDLKPENILLSDKTREAHVLIADFGLGRFISQAGQQMDTVCGTHHYLAPELVRCDRGDQETYDQSIDVWGVGLIMFIMLFGYNPFLRESNLQTHQAIVDCKYTFPKDDNASKTAKEMIKRMVRCLPPLDAEDRAAPYLPDFTSHTSPSIRRCASTPRSGSPSTRRSRRSGSPTRPPPTRSPSAAPTCAG